MFSSETLIRIFARRELQVLDMQTQSDVVHAIEEVLEQDGIENADESVSDNVSTGISAE